MKSYRIQLTEKQAFTCITDEAPDRVADAIYERFLRYPLAVTAL